MGKGLKNGKTRTYPDYDRLLKVESELKSQKYIINKILEKLES